MTLAHGIKHGKIKDEKRFNFDVENIYNGCEIINENELGLFNKTKGIFQSGINQFYIDSENIDDFEFTLNLYKNILEGKFSDCLKIEKNYVFGGYKKGVL